MKRISFHLNAEQVERLYTVAAQYDISASELVRRCIDQGLARLGAPSAFGEQVDLAVLQQRIVALEKTQHALLLRLERGEHGDGL